MRTAAPIAYFVFMMLPIFFWLRGILKGNKGDARAGIIILMIVALVELAISGGFEAAGGTFFLFGLATLFADTFAAKSCPVKRSSRVVIGVAFVVMGLLGMIMM